MTPERLHEILAAVARGEITPEDAAARLADLPYADLGYAKLDLHRELRNGLPEAVFGEGKTEAELIAIACRLFDAHGRVLVTRLAAEPGAALVAALPGAVYHTAPASSPPASRPRSPPAPVRSRSSPPAPPTSRSPRRPRSAPSTGSASPSSATPTSASPASTACSPPSPPSARPTLVIAVAGMDGALPTVLAGLIPAPVIAVPTSIGYGAAFGGIAPLLTMLNACAPGVAVVNIDNGYGAAVVAWRIVQDRRQNIASP